MEVEKYMIHVGDVLEDPDMCFAHLLEGKEKKETCNLSKKSRNTIEETFMIMKIIR